MDEVLGLYLIRDVYRIVQSYYRCKVIASWIDEKTAKVFNIDDSKQCVKFNVAKDDIFMVNYDDGFPSSTTIVEKCILLFPALDNFYYCANVGQGRIKHIITGTISNMQGSSYHGTCDDRKKEKCVDTVHNCKRNMFHIFDDKPFDPIRKTFQSDKISHKMNRSADDNYGFLDTFDRTDIFNLHYNVCLGYIQHRYPFRRLINENYYVADRIYDVRSKLIPIRFKFEQLFIPFCFVNDEIIGAYCDRKDDPSRFIIINDIVSINPKTDNQRIICKCDGGLCINPFEYDSPKVNVGPNGTVIMFDSIALVLFNTGNEIRIFDIDITIKDMCVI